MQGHNEVRWGSWAVTGGEMGICPPENGAKNTMTVHLLVWHCTKPGSLFWCHAMMRLQFTHDRSFACISRLWNVLVDCWSLFCNNNTAVNLQTFISSCRSRCFSTCDQGSRSECLPPRSEICFFSWPGCLGLIMKNRVKSGLFEVIN